MLSSSSDSNDAGIFVILGVTFPYPGAVRPSNMEGQFRTLLEATLYLRENGVERGADTRHGPDDDN
jgi:hypothetical protein